jgi:hypothetical protein
VEGRRRGGPRDEVWIRYGFRGSKTLVLNCETTANSSLVFTNANSVDSVSGDDILFESNHASKGFTIKFDRIIVVEGNENWST